MTGLLQWVGKWLQENQERQYLHGLGSAELMDVGISRPDFMTALAAPEDPRERMLSMAAAYGLPSAAVDRDHWRALDIARACAQCRERVTCKRWLNGLEENIEASAFCPNADHYNELALSYGVKKAAHAKPQGRQRKERLWHI